MLALVVALVFGYNKIRVFYLQRDRRRLQQEVAIRTAEQQRLITKLNSTVTELTNVQKELSDMIEHRENIVGVLIHDIKSPLRFLNTVSAHLAGSMQQNDTTKNKTIASEMAASLNRLYLFVHDFAVWLGAASPGHLQVPEKTDLNKILSDTVAVYKDEADRKGITIQQASSVPDVYGDPAMLKAVVRNVLDNSIKNSEGGNIVLSVSCPIEQSQCEVTVTDEGKGLTEDQVSELNRYFNGGQKELSFSAERSGHKILKDFIQKLGGRIVYRQNNHRGLAVTVTLPAVPPDVTNSN